MIQLGWSTPAQQVRITTSGGVFYADFDLPSFNAWGEFDGEVKYRDKRMRGDGQTIEDVMIQEKRREDLIRLETGRRIIRWGWKDVRTLQAFRRFADTIPRETPS